MEDIVRLDLKDVDDIYILEKICFPDDYTKRDTILRGACHKPCLIIFCS